MISSTRSAGAFNYLATPVREDDRMVTASFGGRIQFWSLRPTQLVSEFESLFPGVHGRLAVCTRNGSTAVVVGGWRRDGLAAYDAASGALLWRRKDLPEAQSLAAIGDGSLAAVMFLRQRLLSIDPWTGATQAMGSKLVALRQSAFTPIVVGQFHGSVALVRTSDWSRIATLQLTGGSFVAAAFSEDGVLISDFVDMFAEGTTGAVNTFDLHGSPGWRVELDRGRTAPWLFRDAHNGEWLGVLQDPDRRVANVLVRWDDTGAEVSRLDVPVGPEYGLFLGGTTLFVAPDLLLDLVSGTISHLYTDGT